MRCLHQKTTISLRLKKSFKKVYVEVLTAAPSDFVSITFNKATKMLARVKWFNFCYILSYFVIAWIEIVNSKCKSSEDREIIDMLFKTYKKELPNVYWNDTDGFREVDEEEDPVVVTVELHVQDISGLSEKTSDFEIDILFSQLWYDPNLSFQHFNSCKHNLTLESIRLSQIWTPNTCVVNSKDTKVHKSPTENIMLILYEVCIQCCFQFKTYKKFNYDL